MGAVEAAVETLGKSSGPSKPEGNQVSGGGAGPFREDGVSSRMAGSAERGKENGVRVCAEGKEDLGGKGAGVVPLPQSVKAKEVSVDGVVRDLNFEAPEEGDGGLEDFEMNGVSSLLKMKESRRGVDVEDGSSSYLIIDNNVKGVKQASSEFSLASGTDTGTLGGSIKGAIKINGGSHADSTAGPMKIDELVSENAVGEGEDVGEHHYSVGDLVWGKIKSHPWWPGRIYDSSDASEYAMRLHAKGKLLVAYFGDGTFAWCHPSQLKPFEENLEVMMKQSTSKNFVNAVEVALDEIGTFVNLRMTCTCVPVEKRLTRPLAANSGIKEGVFVSDNGIRKLLAVQLEPAVLLANLKLMAKLPFTSTMLEQTVLNNWLSAFYCAKGFDQLPSYYEPVQIPGLEDLRGDVASEDGEVGIPFQGPVLEEWLSSPTDKPILQKCPRVPGDQGYKKQKQKSIAEIIGGDLDVQAKDRREKKGKLGIELTVKKKRVTGEEAGINDTSSSQRKLQKLKRSNLIGSPLTTESKDLYVQMSGDDGGGGHEEESKKRGRKRKEISAADIVGPLEEQSNKPEVTADNLDAYDGDPEQPEKGSSLRERKKSKYLSPPYTNISRGHKQSDTEAESLKISSLVQPREGMTKVANKIRDPTLSTKSKGSMSQEKYAEPGMGDNETDKKMASDTLEDSTLSLKSKGTESQEKSVEESGKGGKKLDEKISEMPVQDHSKIVDASANEVLWEVQATAVDPLQARENKSIVVDEFLPMFRSSVYSNGSNYKRYNKRRPGRKRKSRETEPDSEKGAWTNQSETLIKSSTSKSQKKIKKDESNLEITKAKLASKRSNGKKKLKENPGRLLVRFNPGSSLPTKDDLIKTYGKFGSLNELETDVCCDSLYALVVFKKSTDAEEALKSSQKESPFGSASAGFEFRCDSATPMTQEHSSNGANLKDSPLPKQKRKTPKKQSASQCSVGEVSEPRSIVQKLKKISSMVDKSQKKLSENSRCALVDEIKDLMEMVAGG